MTPTDVKRASSQACSCENDAPLVHALFTIHHLMMRIGDRLTAPHGLTSSRWMLLCSLDRRGDAATVSDLAEEQMMSVQAISRMLGQVVSEGLVTKEHRPGSGRTAYLSLTPKGRESVAILRQLGESFSEHFLDGLDSNDITRIETDLARIVENLSRYESELTQGREGETRGEECV